MEGNYWSRLNRARVTRRRLLRGTALGAGGAAAAWALAACGEEEAGDQETPAAGESPTAGPTETPKMGGRYQTSATANFDTFDPHLGIATSTAFFGRVYNVLLSKSATKPEFIFYDMAETYEQPDETTYIFNMRSGVKIAPNDLGVPERDLDAEDARVSFDRMKTEPRANAGGFVKKYIDKIEATDPMTFKLTTVSPYAWFLDRVGFATVTCIPPRELILNDPSVMQNRGVGAGPNKLVSFTEGEGASFDRNPNYYLAPTPYIDGFDVKIVPDRAARRTAFLSRQLHTYGAENKAEADDLLKQGDFYTTKGPVFSYISLVMNAQQDPWKDARLRRAVSRAIKRQQYIDIISLGDGQANGLVHWPTGSYALPEEDLNTKYQPYDPEEARSLIQEATGGSTLTIKLAYPTLDPIPQYLPILLEQFKAAGIEVEQDPQDFSTWLDNYRKRNYSVSLSLNQTYESPEVPLAFQSSWGPIGDKSFAIGLEDAEIDAAIDKANTTTDPEELIKAVHDAQILIYSKDPNILHFYSGYSYSLYWDFVKNVPQGYGTTAIFLWNQVWLDL